MTRDAYVFMRQYIHFCDNSKRISAGNIGHDPLFKVRYSLDTMMGGMVMNDDPYAPPDPHTMTCGVVAELEARSVPPKTYPLPRPRAAADSLCTSGGALARADAGGLSAGTFWGVAVGFAVVLVVALVIVVKKTKTLKGVRLERHGSMSLTFANPNAYDSAAEVDGVDGSAETSA